VHAILSDAPVILIPLAFATELLGSRVGAGRRVGGIVTSAAAASALAAGSVGWIDWLTIPASHPVRRPATVHGLINSLVILGAAAAVPARRQRLGLLGASTTAMFVGAWIGGDLVFRHGWRVRPAEEAELVEERLDDPAVVAAFAAARRDVDEFEREKTFLPAG
jgi:hypothetical protein